MIIQNNKLLKNIDFKNEKELQSYVEKNMEEILGYKFIATEFSVGDSRLDSLGYDKENNTFIIIEYKNIKNNSLVDQGYSYLALMLERKEAFVLKYNNVTKSNLEICDIDWSQSRIIFISPFFSSRQISATEFQGMPFDLIKATKYENDIVEFDKISKNPIATIDVKNYGTIKVELYPDIAPNTVANFITLANRGYYDGKTFHRTVPDLMIQGGSKDGDGKGAPTISDIKDEGSTTETYAIKGEFIANDYSKNTLKMKKGVIAMARADYSNVSSSLTRNGYNSADSQFFIMNADNDNINGLYAGFGEVIEGLDVVDAIANVEVVTRESKADGQDKPVDEPKITSIRVETYGVDYGEPETIEPFNYYNWLMKQYSTTQSSNN